MIYLSIFLILLGALQNRATIYTAHLDDVIMNVPVLPSSHERTRRDSEKDSSRENHRNLRIYPVYDSSFLNEKDSHLFKTMVVEKAIRFWESSLYIKSPLQHFLLDQKCLTPRIYPYLDKQNFVYFCADGCATTTKCGLVTVPNNHLNSCRLQRTGIRQIIGTPGEGIRNHDFVLYISSIEESRCINDNATLAFAAHCQLESGLDRPIAGFINICPRRLSVALGLFDQAIFTAKHEILHALGFAHSLFAFYRRPDGTPFTPRNNQTGRPALGYFNPGIFKWSDSFASWETRQWVTVAGTLQRQLLVVRTPNVVREARDHFNCSTMPGMELENQGGVGVAYSHWEKRLLENDIMSPAYTHRAVVSRITLALMHDTGWYVPDYNKATQILWGKSLGCDFAMKSCFEYMQLQIARNASISPYCTVLATSSPLICSEDYLAYGRCNLVQYNTPLEPEYQNLPKQFLPSNGVDISYYGGSVATADYCPYVQEFNWKISPESEERDNVISERTTHCTETQNNHEMENNFAMETYKSTSKCFVQTKPWRYSMCDEIRQLIHYGAGCYEYECSSIYGLIIYVNSQPYQCLRKGQVLEIETTTKEFFSEGGLLCPDCSIYCQKCVQNPAALHFNYSHVFIPCPKSSSSSLPRGRVSNSNNSIFSCHLDRYFASISFLFMLFYSL